MTLYCLAAVFEIVSLAILVLLLGHWNNRDLTEFTHVVEGPCVVRFT